MIQVLKSWPTLCQVICVCLWACEHLFPHVFVWVVAWMRPHGGEVNWHTPEEDRGGTRSDLFKTHTIWVARLQARTETAVSVSEVKREKEKKPRERRKSVNSQFSIFYLLSLYSYKHIHTHSLNCKNLKPSTTWDVTEHDSMRFFPAWLWDPSDSYVSWGPKKANKPEDLQESTVSSPHAIHKHELAASLTYSCANTHRYRKEFFRTAQRGVG